MINSWKFERFVIRFPMFGNVPQASRLLFPTLGTFSSNLWSQPSPTCPAEALAKEEGYGGQEICAYLRPSADAFFQPLEPTSFFAFLALFRG